MDTISTPYGELPVQKTADDLRKKEILPVTYYANGTPKAVPLEAQTPITTPLGEIPAELVTFHENGKLNRIFPLNGKLTGYWGEADERELARPLTVQTPAGAITALFISLGFHDNGALRSVTMWPGETVAVWTPAGRMEARIGLSFGPDGTLCSLEPASPTPVVTEAGEMSAFNPDAVGVNGDTNSLAFDPEGNVVRVTTTLSRIKTVHADGRVSLFAPEMRESLCGDSEKEITPMAVAFNPADVSVWTNPDGMPVVLPREGNLFFAEAHMPAGAIGLAPLRCSA